MLLAFYGETDYKWQKNFRLTHLHIYILQIDTVFEIHNCKIFEMCIFLLNATVYVLFAIHLQVYILDRINICSM